MVQTLKTNVQGYFKKLEAFKGIDVLDEDGNWTGEVIEIPGSRRQVGWENKNQILDNGRNNMATQTNWAGSGSKAQVGTDNTVPTAGDTQLGGYVAGTAVIHDYSDGSQGSPPYYGWALTTYRFAQGDAAGNLQEAGVGWSVSSGAFLISRALIVDGNGDTTTATVLFDEYLDLTYELRYYPPLNDVLGTIELDGIVYDTIARAAAVTSWGGDAGIGKTMGQRSDAISDWSAYDGDIGTIIQSPSGVSAPCDNSTQFNLAYSNNSYQIDMQCDCGIGSGIGNAWNLSLGIRSVRIRIQGGWFQIQFNAQGTGNRIPKTTGQQIIAWIFRLGWAAHEFSWNWTMQAADNSVTPTTGKWNTNVAQTLLRINWTDDDTVSRQALLKLGIGTKITIAETAAPTKWIIYTTTGAFSEGTDWTDYAITTVATQAGGPTVGALCSITGVDS